MDWVSEDLIAIYCKNCDESYQVIAGDETQCPACESEEVENDE